ncbi:MAG: hypothetical protein DWQ10_00095 [Calditrichaeota bacterium]|nr:MAG: hypothetical protein DWQ10_00095 [Calditrichota bacterium]
MQEKRKPISIEEVEANKNIYQEHFNADYAEQLVVHILQKIDKFYFRSSFIGFDEFPQRNDPEKPLIFASNHSGMAFPWDAIMLVSGLLRINNYEHNSAVRALTAPMLSDSVLMNPFLVENFWKKCGGIDATFLNFETMLHYNDTNLLIYPEGVPGIGKGFPKRYQLQRFSSSLVKMSIKYKTDIVSIASVNGEYINPYNLKSDFVNKLAQKIGIPFIPVGLMSLLIPFQPWIFYFGFPAKLTYICGSRIKPYEMIDKDYWDITEEEFREITKKVKQIMQDELHAAVQKHGRIRYKWHELLKQILTNLRHFPYFLPFCWPSVFCEFDMQFHKNGGVPNFKMRFSSIITIVRHNPIILAFFIPILGWIPILIRGMRKVK